MLGTIARHQCLSASYETLPGNVRGCAAKRFGIAPGIEAMLALVDLQTSFTGDFAITSICSSAQRDKSSCSPYLRAASIAVSFSARLWFPVNPPPAGCSDHGCPGDRRGSVDNQLVGDTGRA